MTADAAPGEAGLAPAARGDGRLLSRQTLWVVLAVALAAGVFAIDTFSDYESAIAVVYGLVVVIGGQGRGREAIAGLAALCVALAVISFVMTHAPLFDGGSVGRLVVSIGAIVLTAALLISRLTVQRTRQALAESEANLRMVADSVPQILWQALPDGQITYMSRRWNEATGSAVEEGLSEGGWRWVEFFHPDDRPALMEEWRDACATGRPLETYRRLRYADGSYRWLQLSARPVRAEADGRILRWYGVSSDIDAEMRARLTARALNQTLEERVTERTEELVRSEKRYRTIFEQAHIAMLEDDITGLVAAFDRMKAAGVRDLRAHLAGHPELLAELQSELRLVDANDAAAALFGARSREELIVHARPFLNEGMSSTIDHLVTLYERRDRFEGMAEMVGVDGRHLKVLFGVTFTEGASNRVQVIVGMVDVTERERAQELLLAAQEDLARANRTATVGALSASIAHELNQPIGALMMDAQTATRWLEREPANVESARRALQRVASNAERASGILRRTREQLVKGRRAIRPLDVVEVVRSAAGLIDRELKVNRTRLVVEAAPGLARVEADRIELQQVVVNLMMNAVQAMRQTEPGKRSIAIVIDMPEEERVRVAVSDAGTGIDLEHIGRLFEPFFTTKPEGMGMGLQICRSTIQGFGGDLSARNNEGGPGATFEFVLPAASDAEAAA